MGMLICKYHGYIAVGATLSYTSRTNVITGMNGINPRETAFEACKKLGVVYTKPEARRRWDEGEQ